MKVFGVTDGKYFVASAGHYDFIGIADLFTDGGQPGTIDYAGYTKHRGVECWAEIKDLTYAEFYTDYQNSSRERQYGIWMFKPLAGECQVRILDPEEIPDTESMVWRKEMAIWGTRGIKGDQPLKYIHLKDADTEHLEAILETQRVSPQTAEVITSILDQRIMDAMYATLI
jgi:hypothetical protein